MMDKFQVIEGSVDDLDLLVEHRLLMWKEIYPELLELIEKDRILTRKWIERELLNKRMVPLLVKTAEETVVGSGCIMIKEDQPRPGNAKIDNPYLLSMYTSPEFRRMGVASLIVKEAISWSRNRGYDRIVLHASKQGRSIYEKFGFQQTNEMKLKL